MADTHYEVGTTAKGQGLRAALSSLRTGLNELQDHFNAMTPMLDGDGSLAAHYTLITTLYGMESNQESKDLYAEINSTLGNSAALRQLVARTG